MGRGKKKGRSRFPHGGMGNKWLGQVGVGLGVGLGQGNWVAGVCCNTEESTPNKWGKKGIIRTATRQGEKPVLSPSHINCPVRPKLSTSSCPQ